METFGMAMKDNQENYSDSKEKYEEEKILVIY